jgi:glycosyltransferase involved in cell wall biosynthesis
MPKLKILIVCEHASDAYGGEAILPLNYFRCLAKTGHQVYLITHARVAASLSQCGDIQQDHVFYVPDTMAHKFLNRLSKKLPQRLSVISVGFLIHLLTQFYQWKLARKIIKEKQIDIVHEPAPVSATLPSAMFALGVPVIIGPMNGGMTFPRAFQYMAGWSERILYKIIRAISSIYNLIIPGKFLATMLLVANDRTRKALPKLRLGKVITLVENGVFSCLNTPKAIAQPPVIHVLYVGRLIDLKMIDVAIEAVAKCADNIKLTILGDGPLRRALRPNQWIK